MKKCQFCNKEFEPKNPKGRFCSDKCRVYYSRKKVVENNKPENKERIEKERETLSDVGQKHKLSQPILPKDCQPPEFKDEFEKELWEMQQQYLTKKTK